MPHGALPVQHRDILRYEEIARMVRIAASLGITKVRITGGEPLVRKDCVQLIKMIREISEIDTIAMTTNGILLPEYLSELVQAGLKYNKTHNFHNYFHISILLKPLDFVLELILMILMN